ncbi:MAG: hypothetical protein ACOCV4_00225 [Myxococcota bacterium]
MSSSPVVPLARRIARTGPGAALGRVAYVAAARAASLRLGRLPAVEAVYLTGSVTRVRGSSPGYSDIDLVLAVDVPTLEDELALRRDLARWLRRAHRAFPAFQHLDYIEGRDLELLRAHGDEWSLDVDSRWVCSAGVDGRAHPVPRPAFERRLARAQRTLRRWVKAGALLLDTGAPGDFAARHRSARRLLSDLLAARGDMERRGPLEDKLARAGEVGPAVHRVARCGPSAPIDVLLSASFEVLEALCTEVAADWQSRLPQAAPSHPPPSALVDALAEVDRASGAGPTHAIHRGGGRRTWLVVTPAPGPDPGVHLAAVRRWNACRRERGLPEGLRPVPLGPAMARAAALLDPIPFVGMALAATPDWAGRVARPSDSDLDVLLRLQLAGALLRPQGRALRIETGPEEAREAVATELALAEAGLALRADPASLRSAPPPPMVWPDERARVRAMREVRARLRSSLQSD